MEKKLLTVNDSRIAYIETGEPSAPPVLLLHGFPETSLMWEAIVPTLQKNGYRAIAPDLPGFGQSEPMRQASTWENYIDFITRFLDALRIADVHLVVHDWGGLIGLRWACDHSARVKSLVLSSFTFSLDYEWHELAQAFRTPQKGEAVFKQLAENKELWQERMRTLIPAVTREQLTDFYGIYKSPESRRVALELYRSGDLDKLVPYQEKLKQMECPVTVISGEMDMFVPVSFASSFQDLIAHANIHKLPDAGHFVYMEQTEIVSGIIADHFVKMNLGGKPMNT
ncbi:alpha/beta fold hydrolase [Brevibacillus reuszeri]|nr:alpha/beta hydrolase [Brevibacillus reuszeri]MED1861235.1 alpha/beta hydrolase [Brevibacillus reuszeri]